LSLDSLYAKLSGNAEIRHKKGDFSQLDLLNIRAKHEQAKLNLNGSNYNIGQSFQRLKTLMNSEESFGVATEPEILSPVDGNIDLNPVVRLLKLQDTKSEALLKIEKNRLLPDISLNYFLGSNPYDNAKSYSGFQVGLAVPLFFGGNKAQIKSAKLALTGQQLLTQNEIMLLKTKLAGYKKSELKYRELIDYYHNSGKLLHDEILRATLNSFQRGEIDLFKFVYSYENAVQIKLDYLDNVFEYNKILLDQIYLSN
jgi:cobalt-zinc-cadmium resistance protein CzcA